MQPRNRWKCVRGPLSAAVATLLDRQWLPALPHKWLAPERTQRAELGAEPGADQRIAAYFTETAETDAWKTAAAHFAGQGLDEGKPCTSSYLKARKFLVKSGRLEQATALDAVAAGGATCGSRWATEARRICTRCTDNVVETPWHRYYLCRGNALIDDSDGILASTAGIIHTIGARFSQYPCLWARALLPASLVKRQALPRGALQAVQAGSFQSVFSEAQGKKLICTDGSGGVQAAPSLVRVGAAVAALNLRVTDQNGQSVDPVAPVILDEPPECQSHGAALRASQVPGRQTVPRAEAFGARLAIEEGPDVIGVDATYALGGLKAVAAEGPDAGTKHLALRQGANADICEAVASHQPSI